MKIKKSNNKFPLAFFLFFSFGLFFTASNALGDAASLQACQQNCSSQYSIGSTEIMHCNLSCQQAENPSLTPSQICGQQCLASYDPSTAAFTNCVNACTSGSSGTGSDTGSGSGSGSGSGTSSGGGSGTGATTDTGSGSAISSQCTTQNADGTESGCRHTNDQYILDSQCKTQYASNPSACSSMSAYLAQMQSDCNSANPSGINCSLITAGSDGGVYGTQASAFANYQASSSSDSSSSATSGQLNIPKNTGLPDPANGIADILKNLLNWLLGIIGVIALISFIISGLQYFMAAGSENTMETAKRNMTYSIIGVIVALSGFIVIQAIDTALRASSSMF